VSQSLEEVVRLAQFLVELSQANLIGKVDVL
jgi:hypothetical protein